MILSLEKALEKRGAVIEPMRIAGHSALLVGHKHRTYLLFPWNPSVPKPPSLKDWLRYWPGEAAVVHSPMEAIEALGIGNEQWVKEKPLRFGKLA